MSSVNVRHDPVIVLELSVEEAQMLSMALCAVSCPSLDVEQKIDSALYKLGAEEHSWHYRIGDHHVRVFKAETSE